MPEKPTGSSPGWDPQLEALAAEAHDPVREQAMTIAKERKLVMEISRLLNSLPDPAPRYEAVRAAWREFRRQYSGLVSKPRGRPPKIHR